MRVSTFLLYLVVTVAADCEVGWAQPDTRRAGDLAKDLRQHPVIQQSVFRSPEGLLLVTVAPIGRFPMWESLVDEVKARGGLNANTPPGAVRVRAYWIHRDSGEPKLLFCQDWALIEPGFQVRRVELFDARYEAGVLLLVYCDGRSIRAIVADPQIAGTTLLRGEASPVEVPDGINMRSSAVVDSRELEENRIKSARFDGTLSSGDLKLMIEREDGNRIVARLKRDGEGYAWIRDRREAGG